MSKIFKDMDEMINDYMTPQGLSDILSVGFEGIRYWGTTSYNEDEYNKSKQNLLAQGHQAVCWEEVLGQMLLDGHTINIVDIEDEDSEYTKPLTLEKLKNGIKLYILNPQFHSEGNEDWRETDAIGGDQIIQLSLYEDLIFG